MEIMSAQTLMIRDLATAAAAHPKIESAVNEALRRELPGVIEEILSIQYGGQRIEIYVAKHSASSRRDRDNAIRAKFNGRNAIALSKEFKLSTRQIMRIGTGKF
jgi:Mor family transcriptional regulator